MKSKQTGRFKFGWRRKTIKGGYTAESDDVMPIPTTKPKRKGDKTTSKKKVFPNGIATQGVNKQNK